MGNVVAFMEIVIWDNAWNIQVVCNGGRMSNMAYGEYGFVNPIHWKC